jgi:Flp pilus assembly protein TadG
VAGNRQQRRHSTLAALLFRDFSRDDHASAAVEFAMCAPILIMLSLATIEVGRVMLAYHNLSLATFEAGRFAMVHGTGSGAPATATGLKSLVAAGMFGMDPAQLQLTAVWNPDKQPGSFVTITLQYPFDFLIEVLPDVTLTSDITTIIAN